MRHTPVKESDWANQLIETVSRPKLSEVLFEVRERSFASLAALPSNFEAIEAALLFTTGFHSLLAIVGPSGWGKTHLLGAICNLVSRQKDPAVDRIPVLGYLSGSSRSEAQPLILDDVQDVFGKPRQRQALQLALGRRVRSARPTVLAFAAAKPDRQVRSLLPCPREWTIVTIGEPAPEERVLLLNQMARQEGLALSSGLVRIIALQMHGDGRTYLGALKRLRTSGLTWLEPEQSLRAVGLLDPFFRDNADWDLKIRTLQIAEHFRPPVAIVPPLDLALYTMRHTAALPEDEVARAAGITPAEVYHRTARFEKRTAACGRTAAYVRQFAERVVGSLAEER